MTWPEYLAYYGEEGGHADVLELEKAKFAAADVSGDGTLAGAELRNFFHAHLSAAVMKIESRDAIKKQDKDGDGKLNFEEFADTDQDGAEDEKQVFAEYDVKGDGFLDDVEYGKLNTVHPDEATKHVFELGDEDKDGHLTQGELLKCCAGPSRVDHQGMLHLQEWIEHAEL